MSSRITSTAGLLLVGAAFAMPPGPASASAPQAWEEFRRDVEAACRAAAAEQIPEPQVVVDPFGLQSYGLAFLNGVSPEGEQQSLVCVYDKVARTVELGGTLALERAVPSLRPEAAVAAEAATAGEASAVVASDPAATAATTAGMPAAASERLLSPLALETPPEIAALQSPGEGPAPAVSSSGFGGLCDEACAATLDALAPADRENLADLSDQIRRTVSANEAASLGAAPAEVRRASDAAALAASGEGEALPVIGPDLVGSGSCTLYYFGYQDEAARTVGTHQCRISEGEGGALVVEKTSGEGLRGELRPLAGGVAAFVGRTYAAGAGAQDYDPQNPQDVASDEFGNTVGFATAQNGELLVISSQRRRFEESDRFFWVLSIDPS